MENFSLRARLAESENLLNGSSAMNNLVYSQSLTILNDQRFINKLKSIWLNEKFVKELLKYNDNVISQALELVENREKEIIQHNTKKSQSSYKDEDIDLMELDLERVKFIIKDYMRIRIAKIEKYLFYIIKNDLTRLLSKTEFDLAFDLFKLKKSYFNESFNKRISQSLNDFKANELSSNIIVSPPENAFVNIRSNCSETVFINMKDIYPESSETASITRDEVYCLSYNLIKEKLAEEDKIQIL